MSVPLSYSIRNLKVRKLTTFLTTFGMALVVFVFSAVLMLADGFEKTLVETGSKDNVVVIRKAAGTEVQSGIDRQQANIVEMLPNIAMTPDGKKLLAKEVVVLITLPKIGTGKPSNVVIRGVSNSSFSIRSDLKIVSGRSFKAGSSEIVVGKKIFETFSDCGIGDKIRFATKEWTVVGIFDAGNRAFNSEIWGDCEQLLQAFRRPTYSSIIFKMQEPLQFDVIKRAIETDPRLTLEAKREVQYYKDQSEVMTKFLRILGISVTSIFSIGAVIGAMITMFSAVANRVGEIGTLRALGFQRRDILLSFMLESLLLGFVGGVIGVFFSSFLQFFTVSTVNFQTFSELAFSFDLNFGVAIKSLLFSLLMGLVGGILPAFRAARMNIIDALRTS